MKIKKISIKNCLAIKEELTTQFGDITEITGASESGKTSVLDTIRKALENHDSRPRFVNKDADSAEIIIELDNGMTIERVVGLDNKSKKLEVKDGRKNIRSPQTFINSLIGENNFNPIDFFNKSEKEKAKELLELMPIKVSENDLELKNKLYNVNYNQHGLIVLEEIEKQLVEYRRETGREKKSVKGAVSEAKLDLPTGYDPEKYRNVVLSEKFEEITKAKEVNEIIKKAEERLEVADDNIEKMEHQLSFDIKELNNQMNEEIKLIKEKYNAKIESKENEINKEIEKEKDRKIKAEEYLKNHTKVNIEPLNAEVQEIEKGKNLLVKFDDMIKKEKELEDLEKEYSHYTDDINIVRKMPAELLKKVESPIGGLEVKNGTVEIDGLPLGNLSDGAMLKLAIKISKETSGELKTILINGFEQFNPELQKELIKEFKDDEYQLIITNVTDGEFKIMSDNINMLTGEIEEEK